MRILLSCLQSEKSYPIAAYKYWRAYFVEGLREAGHEILEVPGVDWAEALTYQPHSSDLQSWRARTWELVESFVRTNHPHSPIDLFLGYLYPQQVDVSAIREMQRLGIPCVNFFCDNVREFAKVPEAYRPFSLHWVPEFEALPMYRKAGLPHVHAPMPCWVPPNLRTIPQAETEPPTFLGSADTIRRDLLGRALAQGAHFTVRGPGWSANDSPAPVNLPNHTSRSLSRILKNQFVYVRDRGLASMFWKIADRLQPVHPPEISSANIAPTVFGPDYVSITRQAMVTIGLNRVVSIHSSTRYPSKYSRLRDIEAPMMGACYLTEWTEGLAHSYELGKEIETFRTPDELTAKLNELIPNPIRRRSMRELAQRRALTDLTVPRSIERIALALGLALHEKTAAI